MARVAVVGMDDETSTPPNEISSATELATSVGHPVQTAAAHHHQRKQAGRA
ncbi:MAG: hypothetical protein M0Z88_09660 [Actinomycetota bacterium]|nr:hypothetical protein [Actinomycetota bacterium]